MSAKLYYDGVSKLRAHTGNLCCDELREILISIGFEVRDGRRGGHKIFTHDGLPSFYSGSFNCGHGRNPEIKRAYISKIIRILENHEVELLEYLKEK